IASHSQHPFRHCSKKRTTEDTKSTEKYDAHDSVAFVVSVVRLFANSCQQTTSSRSLGNDMGREPILKSTVQSKPPEVESEDDRALRPTRMSEMIGQREVFARVEIAVDAARKRKESLGHILFDGPPGLGKTTFAMAIPRDLGVTLQIASGAALQ